MAITLYTGARTFTENPSRQVSQAFGSVTHLTCVFEGLEADYDRWAPRLGAPHPVKRRLFLTGIDRRDGGGGLLEVTLTYAGDDGARTLTAFGVPYSNLQMTTQLVNKSFSWSGAGNVPQVGGGYLPEQTEFSVQYVGVEAAFTYTAYGYVTAGQFGATALPYVSVVRQNRYFTFGPLPAGSHYTGVPNLPADPEPVLVLTAFSCKQDSPPPPAGTTPALDTAPLWQVSETWGYEYNQACLGITG